MHNITSHLYLSGGGDEHQTFTFDETFFHNLTKNGTFLYIPVALRGHTLYPTAHLWMNSVLELHGRSDLQFEQADMLSKYRYKDLKLFDAVYIGGGNTWNLMEEMRNSGFFHELTQYITNGGHVYGGSAGAIILGQYINTQSDTNSTFLKDSAGLNVLNGYSVACHYTPDQHSQFQELAREICSPIICLPEVTGLLIQNTNARCVGTESCVIYFANGTDKEIFPHETFQL